jgi:hypothetical protein
VESETVDGAPMRLESITGRRFGEPGRWIFVAGREGSGCYIFKVKLQSGNSGFEIQDLR